MGLAGWIPSIDGDGKLWFVTRRGTVEMRKLEEMGN